MKLIDLAGQKFGRLTAVDRTNGKWNCTCECGGSISVTNGKLRSGNTKSCGCLKSEVTAARNVASAVHGMTKTPTWISWDSMQQRCLNPNHKSFKDYGGRGIKVCARWLNSFENFLADMGKRPEGMTLERRFVDNDYEPDNCRWATSKEQGNNRRSNRPITMDGRTMNIAQWAEELGMSRQALRYRIEAGWDEKDILNMRPNHGNGWKRELK